MKRIVGVAVGIALTVTVGWAIGVRAFTYGASGSPNAGIVVTAPFGCAGFEAWGTIGFFGGVGDPGACDQ